LLVPLPGESSIALCRWEAASFPQRLNGAIRQ
jgi:hypothetical protein